MRILYIHQHFVTDEGTSGTRSFDVGRHLVDMGHEVVILCGRHAQSGLPRMPWYRPYRSLDITGMKVVVCNVPYSNRQGIPARLWAFFGFALLGTLAALVQRFDLVFATSTPLEVAIPGCAAAVLRRRPMVFEVRDLWPEDLVAAGRFKRGSLGERWQGILERMAYRVARRILVVSKGFHDRLLERGYPPELLETIPLGADGAIYAEAEQDVDYMRRHGLADKIVAVYSGAHGNANGLDQLLDAAEHLRDRPDIAILLLGDGKMRDQLAEDVRRRGLTNVHMHRPVPKHELPGILMACDIGLLILKQITRPRWVTPNKLFDYMFAGLPTVVNFAGTSAELVEEEDVGQAAEPGCAEDLADCILFYADNADERMEVGARAHETAFEKYDRRRIAARLAETFEDVIRARRGELPRHAPSA